MKLLKFGTKIIKYSSKVVSFDNTPVLPPYTMRLRYKIGTIPTFNKGVGTLVDPIRNIWDLHYENNVWSLLLYGQNKEDLLEIVNANIVGVTSLRMAFNGCTNLEKVALIDTHTITDFSHTFFGCASLKEIPLLDLSNAIYVNEMFADSGLTSVPLFDTHNVINFAAFLSGCPITSVPLFDTSKATTMWWMFQDCRQLESIPLFNTSNVTNMESMFRNCYNLKSIPLFDTSKVTNVNLMCFYCYKVESGALDLYNQLISQTNPPTSHDNCFHYCGRDTQTGAAELAQIPADWK